MKRTVCILLLAATTAGYRRLAAQEFSATYTTEMQTDFRRAANWVNLLRTDFSCSASDRLRLNLATISIAKTRSERLADDMQVFSNIEEENCPLALAVAGIRWQDGGSTLFTGIRNVNEDYFTSPVTSLFTNSSCGIFPTLSANAPVPNYPLAALGIHYAYDTEHLQVQASLYNGTAYNGFAGRQNVFRFCPASDGLFGIVSLNYMYHDCIYSFGGALHNGLYVPAEEEANGLKSPDTLQAERMAKNIILWGYAEQRLSSSLHLLLQYSVSPSSGAECSTYAGIGIVKYFRKMQLGLFSDYVRFTTGREWATEVTVKVALSEKCSLQPALHCIRTINCRNCIGLLRLQYDIQLITKHKRNMNGD